MTVKPNIFIASLGDFLSPRVLLVSLVSFILTIAFFLVSIFVLFGSIEALSVWFVGWMGGLEQSIEQNWLFSLVSLLFITKAIVGVLIFFTSAFVVYFLFLMVYSLIVGLFASYFIKEIGEKYYKDVSLEGISLLPYLWFIFKILLTGTVLFILMTPLVFVPVLNLLFFVPLYYMFHKMLVLDVSSSINSSGEYVKIKKIHGSPIKMISLVCFGLTLIPFIGVIIYPFYVIVMSHFLFQKTRELRA